MVSAGGRKDGQLNVSPLPLQQATLRERFGGAIFKSQLGGKGMEEGRRGLWAGESGWREAAAAEQLAITAATASTRPRATAPTTYTLHSSTTIMQNTSL